MIRMLQHSILTKATGLHAFLERADISVVMAFSFSEQAKKKPAVLQHCWIKSATGIALIDINTYGYCFNIKIKNIQKYEKRITKTHKISTQETI
tara:strand:- start:69135 stop:69416 length:282 start_codon:yes stop_codon:yes gene_type:complete